MKKIYLLLATVAIAATLNAQGGMPRRTVEERVQMVQGKFDSAFKLEPAKLTQVDTVFANYYRASDKIREELMGNGGQRPDFSVMREKMQPSMDERDKQLKALLSEAQYKTWKDELEPSMRPQRPNGGSRN